MNSSYSYTIAIDAMGGDNAPRKILEGLNIFLKEESEFFFIIFGDEVKILENINKYENLNSNNYRITNSKSVIADKGSVRDAIRNGKNSSMWMAIECVKNDKADLVISSGNTGALLIVSKLLLKMIPSIDKPAIAGLWPTLKLPCVVLDLGANLEFNEKNYIDFSKIGAELYRILFDKSTPTVALMNVGSEESKGHEEIKNANRSLQVKNNNFEYNGYIEGNQIKDGDCDVIVTDGFSGNIALKTAEGTVTFINQEMKKIFNSSFYGKICYFFSYFAFKSIKKNLDPRKYNGGIFLGLNSPVVKSHGGSDGLAFYYSIKLSTKILRGDLIKKLKKEFSNG